MQPSSFYELVKACKQIVGSSYVLTDKVDLSVYECDGDTLDVAAPDLVVLPNSTYEVSQILKLANRYKLPVYPRGAGTGLSGGATTINGGICLGLNRMTKILEIDVSNCVAVVETGITNLAVSEAVAKHNLYFAPDPSSQFASTIGGNIAENSGGPHTLKYGTCVNHVLGVTVVLPDAEVIKCGGKAHDYLGLDLLGVLVGSEGTLGVITEAVLKLSVVPKARCTMLAYFPSVVKASQAVCDIVATGIIPAALEMMDQTTLKVVEEALRMGLNCDAGAILIVELEGSSITVDTEQVVVEKILAKNNTLGMKVAANADERAWIWKARKSALSVLGRIAPYAYVLDGVVPRSKLADITQHIERIAAKYQLLIANVYHAGDGNVHPCILYHQKDSSEVERTMKAGAEILRTCVELGGTLTGEHGIGIEKINEMPFLFTVSDLEAMSAVHDVFNPTGLLNPGKMIPTLKGCGESGRRPLLRHQLQMQGRV